MNIILIFNGLGNQMSQYAFYHAKSKFANNCKIIYYSDIKRQHNGLELTDLFGIPLDNKIEDRFLKLLSWLLIKASRFPYLLRFFSMFRIRLIKEAANYDFNKKYLEENKKGLNIFYGGWHSEKYFKLNRKELKKIFSFPENKLDKKIKELSKEIESNEVSVSMHVRRGDYISKKGAKFWAGICDEKYYKNGIKYFKEKFVNPVFYIFSDDIEWCKKTFKGSEFKFVETSNKLNAWNDMYLMTLCKHHINANSTFSWWGAWLSKDSSITLRPKYFQNQKICKDLYPEDWVVLE